MRFGINFVKYLKWKEKDGKSQKVSLDVTHTKKKIEIQMRFDMPPKNSHPGYAYSCDCIDCRNGEEIIKHSEYSCWSLHYINKTSLRRRCLCTRFLLYLRQ